MDSLEAELPLTGGGSSWDLLEVTLAALVPLRILELRGTTFEERAGLAREASAAIAENGDVILYRGSRPGETGRAAGKLITGLACLAYQPGGVRFGNQGWCAAHPQNRWDPGDLVCARCLAGESACRPAETHPPAAKENVQ